MGDDIANGKKKLSVVGGILFPQTEGGDQKWDKADVEWNGTKSKIFP